MQNTADFIKLFNNKDCIFHTNDKILCKFRTDAVRNGAAEQCSRAEQSGRAFTEESTSSEGGNNAPATGLHCSTGACQVWGSPRLRATYFSRAYVLSLPVAVTF